MVIAGSLVSCKNFTDVDDFDYEAQFRADTTEIRKFITEKQIPAIKSPSGVFYQIIAPGSGNVTYTRETMVSAEYVGRLLNGTVFDQSKGTPIDFALGGVIAGWQIGVPLIQKGGEIRLLIPSQFAYGPRGQGPIAPNTVLDFTIKLADVKP